MINFSYLKWSPFHATYFCAHCKGKTNFHSFSYLKEMREKMTLASFDYPFNDDERGYFEFTPKDINRFRCPECEAVTGDEHLVKFSSDTVDPVIFEEAYLKSDDKKAKVFLKYKMLRFFNHTLQETYLMTAMIMNKETGRITLLRPIDSKNRVLDKFRDFPRIRNFTYGATRREDLIFLNEGYFNQYMIENVVPFLEEQLSEKFGFRPRFNRGDTKSDLLGQIALFFRFPVLDSSQLMKHFKSGKPVIRDKVSKVKFSSTSQLDDLIKSTGIKPTKQIRKAVMQSYDFLTILYCFSGIKDVSNLLKLSVYSSRDMRINDSYVKRKFNLFIKDYVAKTSETVLTNRLVAVDNFGIIFDTVMQYYKLKQKNQDYEMNTSCSIRELHDLLSLDVLKLSHNNKEIQYKEEELELEHEESGYSFKLAPDTFTLKMVGKHMGICVGSYDSRALNHQCGIVTLTDEKQNYIACIELDRTFGRIVQAKARFNNLLQGEERDLVMNWAKKNQLEISTHDLPSKSSGLAV